MDPEYDEEQQSLYRMNMFALILAGLGLLGVYVLWSWCNENFKPENTKPKDTDKLFMKPVYAHEIEPGIVVLQNEEGDYFKILKEYDPRSGDRYGSVACTGPEVTQPASCNGLHDSPGGHIIMQGTHFPATSAGVPHPQRHARHLDERDLSQKLLAYESYTRPPSYSAH